MNALIGDIGGTKTILAIFSPEQGAHKPLIEKALPSSDYNSLEAIIKEFLGETDLPVEKACFGAAGPVINGVVRTTNLPWIIDSRNIQASFGYRAVKLLNDLESVAYAISILEPDDIYTLNKGKPVQNGNIAVLAPGTGLGEGFLTYENGRYVAHASEGSHASFAPIGQTQMDLLAYLYQQGLEHVSFERVCSGGLGIPNIYKFLKATNFAEEPDWLAEKLSSASDPTPIIVNTALDPSFDCSLARETVNIFINILGSEAGNLALKVLSTAGIYLGGGISPRLLDLLKEPEFLEALHNKGRFKNMLSEIPVHVILNTKAGLLGAAAYGLTMAVP